MPKKRSNNNSTPSPYPIRSRTNERSNLTVSSLAEDLMASNSDSEEVLDDGSVSYRLMKNLITKVESSMKAEFSKAVGEIREDVSELKVQIEKYNGSFTEMQERLSGVEDKVEQIDTVKTDIADFKKEWQCVMTQVNLDACKIRKNNIIITGIKGGNSDPDVAMRNFEHFCEKGLKMSKEWIQNVDLNDCYHFSPKGGEGPWPLFVSFAKSRHRSDVFKAAHNLKGTDYLIKNDLAPWLLKIRKDLISEQDKIKKAPHNCQAKMRDTPYRVWMIFKCPNTTKWHTWKGWDNFNAIMTDQT